MVRTVTGGRTTRAQAQAALKQAQETVSGLSKTAEARGERFVPLAERRVSRALAALDLVENLAAYPHDPGQADAIVKALLQKVSDINDAFKEGKQVGPRFRLQAEA